MNIVLASASPRRKELLFNLNLNFEIMKSDIDEFVNEKDTPESVAMSLSFQKAIDIANKTSRNSIVIGADTIVVFDGKILGKPKDEQDAFNTLKQLSGKYHKVITGICTLRLSDNKKIVDYEVTKVKMREFSEDEIKRYIKTAEPMDKAGSYGIQGYGSLLVEKIDGDYSNVVGLPVSKLGQILYRHFDVNII
ncbi:Maf family protein [Tepidibacter aestuarii]|uniref:Maf family protein n=1 Tax=Tepidibacter aestuarii TaxID=2925782 RepID=UPI0020BE1720|nr:Maf family protein [Tepidibacter aestuarii]CAH2214261.1 nucleoside triphosphate pyrophosphatase; septum formation DNA-binding protein (multicopy associated filamentation) [Tepidibacter aestuarii]